MISSPIWKWLVVWRVWLFVVIGVVAAQFVYRPDFAFTNITLFYPEVRTQLPEFVWLWANFDGVHYLRNAYQSLLLEPRYFPLYSLLIKGLSLSWIFKTSFTLHLLVGLVVSHVAFIGSLWLLFRLLRLDHSQNTVFWTLALLIAFPTSFFFVAAYSESLFLFLALLSLWSARQGRWLLSFGIVGLAAFTRLPGILLVVPILWEWWHSHKHRPTPQQLLSLGGLTALAVVPLLVLMLANYLSFNDPLMFLHSHGELANGRSTSMIIFPLITFWRYLKILSSVSPSLFEWWIALLELATAVGAVATLFASWKLKLRGSYQLYTVSLLALPVLSGTFTGLPRYMSIIFPMYMVLAMLPKRFKLVCIGFFLVLQALLLAFFGRGYFVA